jgi:glycosyltransferase involved in cell wall biosynthesis
MTTLQRKIIGIRIKEWLFFDSKVSKSFIAVAGLASGLLLLIFGRNLKGTLILSAVHRASLSVHVDKIIQNYFSNALSEQPNGISKKIQDAIYSYPQNAPIPRNIQRFIDSPEDILNGCTLVLKSPSVNEKGVLYLFYSYLYPLFLRTYDAETITDSYRLVLEPSWSGFCDLNILCTNQLAKHIVVGFGETRDAEFIESVSENFVPGDFTGNTWIDTDTFKPLAGIEKDIDVIVVAAWAWYKRHWAIFKAIKTLRERGYRLKVAFVGYPIDMTIEEMRELADFYGILDQIEFHERISAVEVNNLFNRSRVNLLWSRREGSCRTIPEGMAAGVPAIMRRGFNYGETHAHINSKSGIYSDEESLPDDIIKVINNTGNYSPRDWIVENMTPEASTIKLNDLLRRIAISNKEEWSQDVAIKISTLDGLKYKYQEESERFHSDNDLLKQYIKPRIPS